jgi:HAD superfamily hydrolase (TIGR01509 family)
MARRAVLFDVDGTLVDTNYLHAVAWAEAFATHGYDVSMSTCHGLIGQGSDRLVASAVGHQDDAVVDTHSDIYSAQLHRLRAFPRAADLLRTTKQSGLSVVLATSASSHDVGHLRAAIDADDAIDGVTTNDDVDASKPDPDIVQAALDNAKVGPDAAVFVGDTVWDVKAAERAGLRCVCVLTGGIEESVLRRAGAVEIYQDVAELCARFPDSALGRLAGQ